MTLSRALQNPTTIFFLTFHTLKILLQIFLPHPADHQRVTNAGWSPAASPTIPRRRRPLPRTRPAHLSFFLFIFFSVQLLHLLLILLLLMQWWKIEAPIAPLPPPKLQVIFWVLEILVWKLKVMELCFLIYYSYWVLRMIRGICCYLLKLFATEGGPKGNTGMECVWCNDLIIMSCLAVLEELWIFQLN